MVCSRKLICECHISDDKFPSNILHSQYQPTTFSPIAANLSTSDDTPRFAPTSPQHEVVLHPFDTNVRIRANDIPKFIRYLAIRQSCHASTYPQLKTTKHSTFIRVSVSHRASPTLEAELCSFESTLYRDTDKTDGRLLRGCQLMYHSASAVL